MIIITRYRTEANEKGHIRIISEEESVCPICVGLLKVIGIRSRIVINTGGDKEKLIIRRLRCKICLKIHHELPDCVIPYKRHCAETIEIIISGDNATACCDFVTEHRIRSWWATISLYFEKALASLRVKYVIEFSSDPTPSEIVRAIVNSNLWVHTRSAMLSI